MRHDKLKKKNKTKQNKKSKNKNKKKKQNKGNCLLYLLNKYSKSLILERFWEFNPFSSFVIDCQGSDNEVCVAIDHFSHHAIPAFRICSINLLIYRTFKSGVISEILSWIYKILLTHAEAGLPGSHCLASPRNNHSDNWGTVRDKHTNGCVTYYH